MARRRLALAIVVSMILVQVSLIVPSTSAPTAYGAARSLPCVFVTKRRVDPTMMLLGETIDVTMTVTALCANVASPLHIVLVIDGSAAMAGQLGRDVRGAAADFVDLLDLRDNPATRVAVVGFDDRVRVRCALSNDGVRQARCVDRVGARGAARLEGALTEARRMLKEARAEFPPPYVMREHVVLFAARPDGGCTRASREADRLKAEGVQIETVCAGENCDAPCLRGLATSLRFHFAWRDRAKLIDVFETIRTQSALSRLREMTIIDQLPESLTLLTDTVQPAPWQADPASGRIGWTLIEVPKAGMTVTYRARTTRPGGQPTTLGATGRSTDVFGLVGTFAFPSTLITVLGTTPGAMGMSDPPP